MDTASTTSRVLTYLLNLRYDQLYQLSQIDPHDIHPHARIALQTGEDAQCDKLPSTVASIVNNSRSFITPFITFITYFWRCRNFLLSVRHVEGSLRAKNSYIRSAVSIEQRLVTDRQADRQTDRLQPYTSRE